MDHLSPDSDVEAKSGDRSASEGGPDREPKGQEPSESQMEGSCAERRDPHEDGHANRLASQSSYAHRHELATKWHSTEQTHPVSQRGRFPTLLYASFSDASQYRPNCCVLYGHLVP